MTSAVVTLNSQSYLLLNDDDGGPQSAGVRGSERKQDLTPSTRDVVQGVPGDTDIASGSVIVYGDATGSFGLSDRTLAPGDLARPFLAEADTTRMRQITSWVGTAATTALATRNVSASFGQAVVLVDAAAAFCFLAFSASSTFDLWVYNTGTGAFGEIRTGYATPANQYLAGTTPRFAYGTNCYPVQRATEYAGGLWYAAAGGLVNLSVGAAAAVGDANAAMTCKYLDMLWSFGLTTSGITITPYRFSAGSTPATAGAQVQKIDTAAGSATYGTAINTTVTIQGEYAIAGIAVGESNVFLVTDRSLYRIGWEDGPNVFTFTQLPCPVPAFTSNPIWWNGELWVGAGNQIVHIIPGQRKPDIVTVDDIGNTPQPFSGRVVQLEASQQYLVAKCITDLTATPGDTALVIRNDDGAWVNRRLIQSNTVTAQFPMLQKLDANGYALVTLTSTSTTTAWPLLGAGKNPNNLAVSIRGQEGIERIIFPWEYGESEASLKQLKRCRLQVRNVGSLSSSNHVRALYETDTFDTVGSDRIGYGQQTFFATWNGVPTNTGWWQVAADAWQNGFGDYGSSVDSNGYGYVWTEFDGTAATLYGHISAGAINSVVVINGGANYDTSATFAALPAPGFAGSGATFGTPVISSGAITSVPVTAGGAGYTIGSSAGVPMIAIRATGTNRSPYSMASGSAYPTFRRIRWMAEIGGDTTGTLVPTFVALLWEFNEYSKVEYQFALRLRMRVGDTHIKNGTKGDGSDKSLYDTPAAIVTALDALETLKNQHTTCAYTGLDGHTWTVYVTKVSRDIISVDSTGIQEVEVDLTLQIVPLQGTV